MGCYAFAEHGAAWLVNIRCQMPRISIKRFTGDLISNEGNARRTHLTAAQLPRKAAGKKAGYSERRRHMSD